MNRPGRDLHGAAFEWTSSPWGRGTEAGFFSVRGGNSPNGELTGRCANAEPKLASTVAASIGFRCCAGPPPTVEVVLDVKRGESVKRGQIIAKSGQSGNVSSPQLHFELRKGSTPVDPTSYLAGL